MKVIDSHTEGEPTRVIIAGGPDLGSGPLSERLQRFQRDHDHVRCIHVRCCCVGHGMGNQTGKGTWV